MHRNMPESTRNGMLYWAMVIAGALAGTGGGLIYLAGAGKIYPRY